MKILVTGGGSEEPIDNVRAVCNFSTGRTSAFLADHFSKKGNDVLEIVAEKAIKPTKAKYITYKTFLELSDLLKKECQTGNYDLIVHAAAVSDYSPYCIVVDGKEYPVGTFSKISGGTELTVKMKKNPKLVDSIKSWCKKNSTLVAFKLTSNANDLERKIAVEKIFSANKDKSLCPDFVVSNDLSEITEQSHPCKIFSNKMQVVFTTKDLTELSDKILELV